MKKISYVGGGGTLKAPDNSICHCEATKSLSISGVGQYLLCHYEGATHVALQHRICRNFNCHCEGVKRPSQSQSSCNMNAITTQTTFARNDKKYAFTLAEVLVTLGIIGVVSAMTVPSLMQNYQRQSYVTQLHKVYNELSQALVQYQNDKNALNLNEAGLTNQAAIENFVEKYFKVVNDCGATKTPCFASQYKKLTGTAVATWIPKAHYVISSGASIGVGEVLTGDTLFRVYVDINGQKGPNIWGRDIFIMYIYKNGLLDDSTLSTTSTAPMTEADRTSMFNTSCNTSTTSIHGCFGKILNDNWEMTY